MICFIYPRSIALPPLLTHSLIDDEDSILERSSATKDDRARAPHHHPLDKKKIVKLKKKRPKTQFWGVCGQYSWIYILIGDWHWVCHFHPYSNSRTARKPLIGTQNVIGIESVMRLDFFAFMNSFFFWRLSIFWQKQNKWFSYDKDLQHVTTNLIQPILSQQIFYVHAK